MEAKELINNLIENKEIPGVKIQSFTPEYQNSTYECIAQIRKEATGDPEAKPKPNCDDIHKNFQRTPDEDFWIALDNEEKVVGTTGLSCLKPGFGYVRRVGVLPEFRGRGIAGGLLDTLLTFAQQRKYKEVYLTTGMDDFHANARKMYEKYMFAQLELGDLPKDIGLPIDEKEMERIKNKERVIYKLDLEPKK